jgi:ribosomal protein S18 acetylase RimI-like enzyme
MTIAIVPIREEHIEGFHAALDVVARERAYLTFLEAPPIEEMRAFVRGNIAKGHPQLLALEGDRVVGWCDVTPQARPARRRCGVLGMGLLPDRRGQGLGERLMRRALEASRAFGLARVELTVREDNRRAIALYGKLGFQLEGRNRRAILVEGVYYDQLMMALLFDAER